MAGWRCPPRRACRAALAAEITRLFKAPPRHVRITAELKDAGWKVSQNTVAQLMAEQHLAARRKKKRKATTRSGKGRWRAPDLAKADTPVLASMSGGRGYIDFCAAACVLFDQ